LIASTALGISILQGGNRAGAATSNDDLIARGAYLTGGAGQCADCHRPDFGGGPNLIRPRPNVPWATTVPSLRGLPMFKNDADAIAFLRTGKLPDGSSALAPMPGYRFNEADATAIVAYFRSLK
jgi:mono/diheme cytochrome c family protein